MALIHIKDPFVTLGMEVARSKEGIFISQRKYTLDLLKETGKLGCKPANTPLEPNWKYNEDGAENARLAANLTIFL